MSRFPPIHPDSLTPEQKARHEETSQMTESLFGDPSTSKFLYKDSTGAFIGPFAPLLYTPSLMEPWVKLNVALSKLSTLPAAASEVAILATGSVYQAKYELYAHELVAEATYLSAGQIAQVSKGVKPEGLDRECEVAFDVALKLARGGGPLDEELWTRAVEALGRDGVAALMHYVGMYAYVCIVLNAADVPIPEGGKY